MPRPKFWLSRRVQERRENRHDKMELLTRDSEDSPKRQKRRFLHRLFSGQKIQVAQVHVDRVTVSFKHQAGVLCVDLEPSQA